MSPSSQYVSDVGKVPFFSSLRTKYAVSYLLIFGIILVLLNTYPLFASQDLLFGSKRDALKSQAAVISSALMELESLSEEQVERVMNMLDSTGLSRVLVTDSYGLILYDSLELPKNEASLHPSDSPTYRYALIQEIVLALQGQDVFFSEFKHDIFSSCAATPIVYRGMTIGALYLYEEDVTQGALLINLQKNLKMISVVAAAIALLVSILTSRLLTIRISALLKAFQIVGEGEYGHRLHPTGNDELAHLAMEFNQLTDHLQNTEEVRRRFVSDASHELKTPLASICLLTDSILQTENMDQDTLHEFVGDIGKEAERLTRITEHLLTLSRLDSLPMGQTQPVDLSEVLEQTLTILIPLANAQRISIYTSCKSGCTVCSSRDELHQICFNLIENAIKYNLPDGSVSIQIFSENDQVILEVADSGLGIPEHDMPKIFNRFYRVDKARSRAAGGTGLGLSIVRDTVRRHNGWVTVRPNTPKGCVFTVGFPLCTTSELEEPAHET